MVRMKCRYIVCELEFGELMTQPDITEGKIYKALVKELQVLHGDYAVASTRVSPALMVKYLNKHTNMVMFRCERGVHKLVQSALPFVKKIDKVEMFFKTIHVAGTMRSCMKFIVGHHKSKLPAMISQCTSDAERQKVKELMMESCKESSRSLGFMERQAVS